MTAVAFDNRAITINGERQLLISGAIHYPRSTPAMWPGLMKASRDAGLNCIETYIFWNLHEQKRGVYDFSGRLDLRRFCAAAAQEGLKVILRIGPYICAETNFGGLPPWLCEIEGLRTRTWNQPFMDEMERWVLALSDYIRPLLFGHGGPVILAQFENEYSNIGKGYGDAGQRYVEWAIALGQRLKLDVPLIMCAGSVPGAVETINGYVAAERIPEHRAAHPEQPALWTENWPGWYNCWGYQRHFRRQEEIAYRLVHFIAAGGTGFNYYMWHAGTNFGRECMYLQTTEYGFGAPLDECGRETTLSRCLGHIHRLLQEHAPTILASPNPTPQVLGSTASAYELSADGTRLVFLCNNDEKQDAALAWGGCKGTLKPLSVQVFKNEKLILDTAAVVVEPVTCALQPQRGCLTDIRSWAEPLPQHWPAAVANPTVCRHPVNQLTLTRDETDYCWYSTELETGRDGAGEGILAIDGAGDFLHVYVDGQFAACSATPLAENRVLDIARETTWPGPDFYIEALQAVPAEQSDRVHFRERFALTLPPGRHRIDILCTALGLIKGDWMLGYNNMVFERKGIWGTVTWNGKSLAGSWSLQPGLVGERCRLFEAGAGLVEWQQDTGRSGMRWVKAAFTRPAGSGALMLDLKGMNKGMIWINGHCAGRYWLVEATIRNPTSPGSPVLTDGQGEPTQRYYHLPQEWLREDNTLILFEEGGGRSDQMTLCKQG